MGPPRQLPRGFARLIGVTFTFMLKDLRHGLRMLLQSKGWTAVVVVSLGLGIGANTALFSVVNGLLLRPVPVSDPGSLVRLRWSGENDMVNSSSDYGFSAKDAAGQNTRATFSYAMYRQFLADNRTMSDLVACAPFGRVNVTVDGQAEVGTSFISSGNYYRMLGVSASRGRTIQPDDDRPDAPPVAVISHKYWRSRFGQRADVIGMSVRVNNVLVTIVGVLDPKFTGIQQALADPPDLAFPLALDTQLNVNVGSDPPRLTQPTYWWLQLVGRRQPGVSDAQIESNLGGVFQRTARAGFDQMLASLTAEQRASSRNVNRTLVPQLRVDSARRGVYDVGENDRRSMTILSVVVSLLLLIVCANVANLLLSRAATRHKEIAIRLSMGATRARLVRQMLTESLVLAFVGGTLGVLIGYWVPRLLPANFGRPAAPDFRLVGFVVAVTTLTGVAFGIAPALRATAVSVSTALKEQSRSVIGSRKLLTKALLVAQVAISLVLLVGAGLFLKTLDNLRHVSVGFNPNNLALFNINPRLNRYEGARMTAVYGEIADQLRVVPGVTAVALSQPALLAGSISTTSIFVQGRTYVRGDRNRDSIHRVTVSPGFFSAMELPIRVGREFTDRDVEGAPRVVVINETAARKYFPTGNPLGQRFGSSIEDAGRLEIVGIVRDAKYNSVRDDAPPTMYLPYLQTAPASMTFEVRTMGDPSAALPSMREAVRRVDPNLPVTNVSTQLEQIDNRFQQERTFAQAYTVFAIVALLLASIGLFGVMSYAVARRTAEIGIRMALGAQRAHVLGLVMRESMALVLIGIAIGLATALAAGRWVQSLLYGLAPSDLATLAGAIGLLTAVSAVAGYLPARRASRVDPLIALHTE
jgi:predicted permease